MGYVKSVPVFIAIVLTALVLITYMNPVEPQVHFIPAASPAPGPGQQTTLTDPFTYRAVLGTIDAPADAPLASFLHNTFWRCMDGTVYACPVVAHLPCFEQAETHRRPTQGMTDFCRNNLHAEVIPAVATGRATVSEWTCAHDRPEVVRHFAQPDARGCLPNIWYAISPN